MRPQIAFAILPPIGGAGIHFTVSARFVQAMNPATRAASFDDFVQRVEDCITDAAQRRQFRHDLDSSR